ncbi:growth arrest-specific protein 2-like [Babylonia areolata]|uniref:growth arrest-specific protein 2-like n=1 Tax=Babylonia areolata TaxID=304850 RepID=UPI003FD1DBC7
MASVSVGEPRIPTKDLLEKKPAHGAQNQKAAGDVNGLSKIYGEGDTPWEQEEDHISQRISEIQDSALVPVKEDLAEWIMRLTGVAITAESFMEVLDSGIVLCTISKLIEKRAQEMMAQGKLTEALPDYRLKCNNKAKSGTWFARDNVANFLGWCHAYGMTDESKFDSEDLVSHRQEKPVVNCVLELARMAWRYGIEPPNLIRMEREIDKEAKCMDPPPPPPPKQVGPVKAKAVAVKTPEIFDLDKEVRRMAIKCKCQDHVKRISEGVYNIFGKRVFIRLLHGKHLMVRVGGGWNTLEHYLLHHDPVQVYEYRHSASPDKDGDKYLVIKSRYKSSS